MQDRVKDFENIRNFRDFGGYEGAGGRMVRTGVLFRSAQFGEASPADLAALESYNIKVQADLRRPDERERHGHRWPVSGVHVISSDKGSATQAPHVRFLSEVAVDAPKAHGWMMDYYRDAPFKTQHVETFSAWFKALGGLQAGEAAVVNCAAGKDRTGILCALTHHVLGVDRETMFADYDLTNSAAKVDERLPEMARMFNEHIGKDYDHAVYHPFVGVDVAFLETALDSIISEAGSIDTYLSETLGVSATERDQLRAAYLQ
ncbi:MAG: tyrosine-protein phosphatase [Pseudomonadota bacterium]|nr:tyrosine-protein phosphatase [Pseudomonadota bacterium]